MPLLCVQKFLGLLTSFNCIAYLTDRTERSDLTHTLAHGGKSSKRARHAAITDSDILPSCNACLKTMVTQAFNKDIDVDEVGFAARCMQCCNWDYTDINSKGWEKSANVQTAYPPSKAEERTATYPTTISDNNSLPIPIHREVPAGSHLRPHEQDFDWLSEGAQLALQELTYNSYKPSRNPGGWTATQAQNYLNSMGVATSVVAKIKAAATSKR